MTNRGHGLMTCQEFLNGYSGYLDEELDPQEALRWELHMEECASCGRYDSVMRRGLTLARELPEIEPSSDFQLRLNRRLWELEMEGGGREEERGPSFGTAVSLAIAATLALIAWSPVFWQEPATESPFAERAGPEEVESLFAAGPIEPPVLPAPAHGTEAPAVVASAGLIGLPVGEPDRTTRQWRLYSAGDADLPPELGPLGGWWSAGPVQQFQTVSPRWSTPIIVLPGPYSPLIVGDPDFRPRSRSGPRVRAVSSSSYD